MTLDPMNPEKGFIPSARISDTLVRGGAAMHRRIQLARTAPYALALAALTALTVGCASPTPRDPGALAETYAAQGRWPEAAREIELAVRANPEDLELRRRAAVIHAKAGNVEKGIAHLEMAIQISPGDPEAWIRLGELEKVRSNVADAYVAYRRASELAPEDIRAVSGLALAADSLGFEAEAEQAYARWAELEQQQGVDEVPKTDAENW